MFIDTHIRNWIARRCPPPAEIESRIPEIDRERAEIKTLLSDIKREIKDDIVQYDCVTGTATGRALWKEPAIAIMLVDVPMGCIFDEHTHPAPVNEFVLVYGGSFVVKIKGGISKTLRVGEGAYFRPGEEHTWVAREDSKVAGITIPADMEGYPDVPTQRSSDSPA